MADRGVHVSSVVSHKGMFGRSVVDPTLVNVEFHTGLSGLRGVTLPLTQVQALARNMQTARPLLVSIQSARVSTEAVSELQTTLHGVARELDSHSPLLQDVSLARSQLFRLNKVLHLLEIRSSSNRSLESLVSRFIECLGNSATELDHIESRFFLPSSLDFIRYSSQESHGFFPLGARDYDDDHQLEETARHALDQFETFMRENIRQPVEETRFLTVQLDTLKENVETFSGAAFRDRLRDIEARVNHLSVGHTQMALRAMLEEVKTARVVVVDKVRAVYDHTSSEKTNYKVLHQVLSVADPDSTLYLEAKTQLVTALKAISQRIIDQETARVPRRSIKKRTFLAEMGQTYPAFRPWLLDCANIMQRCVVLTEARNQLDQLDWDVVEAPNKFTDICSNDEIDQKLQPYEARLPQALPPLELVTGSDFQAFLENQTEKFSGLTHHTHVSEGIIRSSLKDNLRVKRDELAKLQFGKLGFFIEEDSLSGLISVKLRDKDVDFAGARALLPRIGPHRWTAALEAAMRVR